MPESNLERAKIKRFEALAAKEEAEAAIKKEALREAVALSEQTEIHLAREREKRARELAANDQHKVYVFDSDVSSSSVKKCIDQLVNWHRQEPGCSIEIQINSPGGVIFDGFHLIDFIRDLRDRGHKVTMVGYGMVASMAAVLLQAADVRVLGASAFMLIHEGSMGAVGDFGDVEDRVKLMKQMHDRILALFEERAKPINPKTTKKFIKQRWERTDWWISAQTALELGFADEVR